MPRKKKEKKTKLEIIREIPSEFKETSKLENFDGAQKSKIFDIGENKEGIGKEESLEEEITPETEIEEETFPEFLISTSSSTTSNPTLQPSQFVDESIEKALENAPSTERRARIEEKEGREERGYEASIYNMPDYGRNYEDTGVKRREMQQTGMLIRPEDIREMKLPRREMEDWHELRQTQTRTREMNDIILEAEILDTERKLPHEQRRKYREIR